VLRSLLARHVVERQVPAQPAVAQGPAVTARVVATWRAPRGGGTPTPPSRPEEEEEDYDNRRAFRDDTVKVKPWTGSRKRSIANHNPASVELEIKAAAEGKSCCANAVWFD